MTDHWAILPAVPTAGTARSAAATTLPRTTASLAAESSGANPALPSPGFHIALPITFAQLRQVATVFCMTGALSRMIPVAGGVQGTPRLKASANSSCQVE